MIFAGMFITLKYDFRHKIIIFQLGTKQL